mmetsp:Transcript_4967/g.9143  ORF Transcript_4967/g.9143 Transcript_4967/m.9143 type:complete len:96 (-) Transcript_4967:538-825(-)
MDLKFAPRVESVEGSTTSGGGGWTALEDLKSEEEIGRDDIGLEREGKEDEESLLGGRAVSAGVASTVGDGSVAANGGEGREASIGRREEGGLTSG